VWFEQVVKPRLKGRVFLIRYADDFVIGLSDEVDARRVMDVLPKRFGRYGLTLHPEKTRLVRFHRPPSRSTPSGAGGGEGPGNFDLLGFTHHWARSQRGYWVVKRKTAKARFTRALKAVSEWCRTHRHAPLREQQRMLGQKLRGHCAYYGITGNAQALGRFRYELIMVWWKWLCRRSQRGRLTREVFLRLLSRYPIPPATAVHSILLHAANP
jgi:hypothetical protein